MCFSTLPMAPSFTTTTNIATTKTSNIDHLPRRCMRSRTFFEPLRTDDLLNTNLVSSANLKIGSITLNKAITTNKNSCPCLRRPQQVVKIEKVFSIKMNFLKVIIGAIKPVASNSPANASSSNRTYLLVGNSTFGINNLIK